MMNENKLLHVVLMCMMCIYAFADDRYARLYVGRIEEPHIYAQYDSLPYYGNTVNTFSGKMSYYGVTYDSVNMRYDLLRQEIVVCTPVTNIFVVPGQDDVDWFELGGQRYVKDISGNTRFAAVCYEGNGLRLTNGRKKITEGMVRVENKYVMNLVTREQYVLTVGDSVAVPVKSASDMTKVFPEYKDEIKRYVKLERLSFSKQKRGQSLTALVRHLSERMTSHETTAKENAGENSVKQLLYAINAREIERQNATGNGTDVVKGIPVLDSPRNKNYKSGEYASSTAYVMPGVKKATQSIADDHELEEIVVVAGRQSAVKSVTVGSEKFKPQTLKNIPSAFGESDIMKIVLTLPGVKTVGEASNGFNVRGGATDQNLILFNNGTVYNSSHLFGLFTSFNSDMVEDVELFKSSIPAQYGGRISSVLNVTSKEASMTKFSGSVSLGLLTSKLSLEIPIVKNHVSLQLSGRTTYSDWMLKMLPEKSGYKDGTANFYDVGGVLTARINDYQRLKIFAYFSDDRFSFSSQNKYGYANRDVSMEWRSILSSNLTATLTAGYDHYDYFNEETQVASMAGKLSFGIDQLWAKLHFRHRLTQRNTLNYGVSTQHYDVQSGKYEPIGGQSSVTRDQLPADKGLESALYVEDEWNVTDKLSVSAGLRLSMYTVLGPRKVNVYPEGELPSESNIVESYEATGAVKNYLGPEVRLSARYSINDNISVKAGFNTMHQYIHKVSNTSVMSPTDIWKLSDTNIKPQEGWQMALGAYAQTDNKIYEFSIEGYYKHISNYLNYRNSAVLLMNHHLETDVIATKGKAYGVELQVKKTQGRLNGWISYCYSRTFLKQDDKRVASPVNGGDWFPTEYDRPHEVKAVVNYKFTERYSFSTNFDYSTGRPTTIPVGQYYDVATNAMQPYYSERNSYRLPDYMRCDVAFNIEPTHKLTAKLHTSFSIGVYNVFARKNAYSVYYVVENGKINGYKLSVFGTAIPYVSINMKF